MRTEKTSVVKSIKQNYRQYQGNSGDNMCVHLITFENGDEGEYHSVIPVCAEFEKGEMANYSIEEKGFRNGKPENRVKPIGLPRQVSKPNGASQGNSNGKYSSKQQPSGSNSSGRSGRNENAIMSQHAITKSIELLAAGGIKVNDLYPKALEILQWTHKYGNMSAEEILNTPVEFEKGKGKGKGGSSKAELF